MLQHFVNKCIIEKRYIILIMLLYNLNLSGKKTRNGMGLELEILQFGIIVSNDQMSYFIL